MIFIATRVFLRTHKKNLLSLCFFADIYSAWLAPSLQNTLSVQTWQTGAGTKMKSYCAGSYHVENILAMKLGSEAFRHSKDHSKWAVTAPNGSKLICIGDINRMVSRTVMAKWLRAPESSFGISDQ